MKCPVCGQDCARSAKDLLATLPTVFLPCADCSMRALDKRLPPPDLEFSEPCSCGKRFIDEIFVHIYSIMVEEGVLTRADPLIAAGSPLVHPGFAMERPPFLPAADLHSVPWVYELLAGCDVRADVFPLATGPLVMYKQQSLVHIEFPRAGYPKIRSVEQHVGKPPARFFIDACSGVGTLGLTAACLGVPHVVLNDAWYASAFWSAFNLEVNREYLDIRRVRVFEQIEDMAKHPVVKDPVKIAETEGDQVIEVYQGDFRELPAILPRGASPVTALDLFDKKDRAATERIRHDWLERVGGEIFIP